MKKTVIYLLALATFNFAQAKIASIELGNNQGQKITDNEEKKEYKFEYFLKDENKKPLGSVITIFSLKN